MLLSQMCLLGEGYVFHTHKKERKIENLKKTERRVASLI